MERHKKTRKKSHVLYLFIYFQWYSNAFISALGGALSLFLGISLSMVFEVIELIIDVILNFCVCLVVKEPRHENSVTAHPPFYLEPFTPTKNKA